MSCAISKYHGKKKFAWITENLTGPAILLAVRGTVAGLPNGLVRAVNIFAGAAKPFF